MIQKVWWIYGNLGGTEHNVAVTSDLWCSCNIDKQIVSVHLLGVSTFLRHLNNQKYFGAPEIIPSMKDTAVFVLRTLTFVYSLLKGRVCHEMRNQNWLTDCFLAYNNFFSCLHILYSKHFKGKKRWPRFQCRFCCSINIQKEKKNARTSSGE
jgi:hypothetical protein